MYDSPFSGLWSNPIYVTVGTILGSILNLNRNRNLFLELLGVMSKQKNPLRGLGTNPGFVLGIDKIKA